MTMEDLLDRITTGTTTERDASEVARLMARYAALKLFVIDVAQWDPDPGYRACAARLLEYASDAGEIQHASLKEE
jgi:hypothetical protein